MGRERGVTPKGESEGLEEAKGVGYLIGRARGARDVRGSRRRRARAASCMELSSGGGRGVSVQCGGGVFRCFHGCFAV